MKSCGIVLSSAAEERCSSDFDDVRNPSLLCAFPSAHFIPRWAVLTRWQRGPLTAPGLYSTAVAAPEERGYVFLDSRDWYSWDFSCHLAALIESRWPKGYPSVMARPGSRVHPCRWKAWSAHFTPNVWTERGRVQSDLPVPECQSRESCQQQVISKVNGL